MRYDLLFHGRDAEELPAALELNDIRKLGLGIGRGGDLVLARAKEDGQAQLAALELDNRRVDHALERVVLYSIRVVRLEF